MIFGKYVNKYYLKYFLFFLIGIIALLAVDYFQLLMPEIIGNMTDTIKGAIDNPQGLDLKIIKDYTLQLLGVGVILIIGRFTWRNMIFGVGVRIEADMRDEMFAHTLLLSQKYYKEHKTGALLSFFTNDLQVIRETFGQGTIFLIDAVFLGILTFIKMFKLNYILALLALIPLVLVAISGYFIETRMEKKFLKRQKAYEKISDFTQENFSGISVIKAFVKEKNEIKHFAKVNKENEEANLDFAKFQVKLDILFNVVLGSIVAVLIYGCALVVLNDNTFTVGSLIKFVSYFQTLVWPMYAISMLLTMRAQGMASLKRVTEFLDANVDITDNDVEDVDQINGEIEFNHLNFSYPDDPNTKILDDVTFKINQGEMVGIIGKTGCGKTTIVDLLLRTYNIDDNAIFIDSKDIMHIPFKKVRQSIGYVPQDNFLFSDTIYNNIAFADDNFTLSEYEVEEAAKMSDLHSNIMDFELKYNTVIGERGTTLSGGQKQRLSIARALIKNPPILILDDSVSAVDTKTEEDILENLKNLRKGKTTILIAHRISTVKDLDKIVIMNGGKVTGIGTHDELLETNSEYKELVRLQSLEKELEGDSNE